MSAVDISEIGGKTANEGANENGILRYTDWNTLVEATQELQEDVETAKSTAEEASTTAEEAKSTAETAQSTAETAKSTAETAQSTAETAQTTAETAQTTAEEAKSAAETAQSEATEDAQSHDTVRFAEIVTDSVTLTTATATAAGGSIVFVKASSTFAYLESGTYYTAWATATGFTQKDYLDTSTFLPWTDKVYICTADDRAYVWSTSEATLVEAGITDAEMLTAVQPRAFVNINILLASEESYTLATALAALVSGGYNTSEWIGYGTVITFLTADGWVKYRYNESVVSLMTDADNWEEESSGTAAVGNCYNVTNEQPISGYYELETAVQATYDAGYAAVGVQITFAISKSTWKMYQYVGTSTDEDTFTNTANWVDLAGMSAGDEALLNIDLACGTCSFADYYTLEYAIAAITTLETETNVTYKKSGLIITYRTGETAWETKQFTGDVADFGETSLWKDFGSGGSEIETADDPEENGKDAFSTGGAYEHIPTTLAASYEDNVLKMQLQNAAGEGIGDEHQFTIQSGGSSTGTVVVINLEESPVYGAAGGTIEIKASIMSVTTSGTTETMNSIETIYLYDRSTNTLLATYSVNQASSADTETFDFTIDVSSYFTTAGTRKMKLVAEDDGGNTGSKNVNVTGVDVTVSSPQTLEYTSSTYVPVGGSRTLSMYKFANNASSQGITCTVEAYIDDEWVTFGTATVSDTYSHSITINANDFCGTVLSHGAVALRIHGVDVASGVEGNYLYTHIMVVDSSDTTPIVVTRWLSEDITPTFMLYETAEMEFAAYSTGSSKVDVEIIQSVDGEETVMQTVTCQRGTLYTYSQRIEGFDADGSASFALFARAEDSETYAMECAVSGSVVDVEATDGALFDIDFASRSNSDSDLSIVDGDYELTVSGANYSTNGFVKDSYGEDTYGTDSDTGVMALRIAENVTAELNYTPFASSYIATTGWAIQFRLKVKNVADDDAVLMSCISGGVGFYVTGTDVVFTTDGAATTTYTITAALPDDTAVDVMIVIEPTAIAPYTGIGVAKIYFDGELIGACQYTSSSLSVHSATVTFDGTEADIYLYGIRAWSTYFGYEEAFDNYLTKMSDTSEMVEEYEFNDVMASQTSENTSAKSIPQMDALYNAGLAYFVLCKNADTGTASDQYPEYLETLDGDKKTTRTLDVYAYFPDRPWQDFKAIGCTVSNQGTTSSQRPIKNVKIKLKSATVTLLNSYEEGDDNYDSYVECLTNAASHKVQPIEGSVPTNIITVKVDYSESGGANNGASTQLFNELQRALGSNYMTPAQNAYTGAYNLQTSIDSIPVAFFRTDYYSDDATSPSYGYFHAKGNWNDDKGDPVVFGFEDVEGYNADCLNYGDFTEHIAAQDQTLEECDSELDKSTWDTSAVHVLSEFCGPKYIVYRYQDGAWTDTTGTMTYADGEWVIEGDVVNPVENYELLTYDYLDWFQGVNSVDDMLAATSDSDSTPIWLQYYESRYPDDDDLNAAYEDGRKVPYRLYKWLMWCQECNQNLTEDDGTITLDGTTVEGTAENRLLKFKHELHNEANVYSMICYHVFTDYIAAVDQRSKNMMVGFYLDTDGEVRMYLNHLYDGDTILGSDNDCGLTIPALLDPNDDPNGYYQGHDSVLFTQLANSDYIWLEDYTGDSDTSDSTMTTTVATIAAAMRTITTSDGVCPFSKAGIEKYWIEQRLSKWPKVVSSYDGLRKYIENSTASANYFYALHGLSIQRLREFVDTRFTFRDGFYQCGDIYDSCVSVRAVGTSMTVSIVAAKAGYFGIGLDQANSFYASAYLDEGESVTFETGATNTGSGNMIYIYGADCIGELDLTNATPIQLQNISEMVLCTRLLIGGEDFSVPNDSLTYVTEINLGVMPFLTELDIRNYPCTSITATYCPRLVTLEASGSALTSFTLAETSPIETLSLPETIQTLSFVNLPNLTYPDGGLTFDGLANVTSLKVSGCEGIDCQQLLSDVKDAGATLKYITLEDIYVTMSSAYLTWLMESGAVGVGTTDTTVCDGLSGTWIMLEYLDDETLETFRAYFTELAIYNAQYTTIVFDDTVEDEENITNLENETGYAYGTDYEPSGHVSRIRELLVPVNGQLNTSTGVWEGVRVSDDDYTLLADGEDFDYTDSECVGNDTMMRFPHCWYKGVNDYKNQKKYIFWSSQDDEPLSTATAVERATLDDILYQSEAAIAVGACTEGETTIDSDGVVVSVSTTNLYKMTVSGMKQVRFPGINNETYGAAFFDADGVCVGTFSMAVSATLFDFVTGDYVFCDVPTGAEYIIFTVTSTVDGTLEAIAVDSSEVEAIEPDWVENEPWLCGVYKASVDGLYNLRSISGATCTSGSGTATTCEDWEYDDNGDPLALVDYSSLNYTMKDFQNLSRLRGDGYQMIDYEMWKLVAILWFSYTGHRDSSTVCGTGTSSSANTGYYDSIGNSDSAYGSGRVKVLGIEDFYGTISEWTDNVAVNVVSYASAYANYMEATGSDSKDAVWHIYDPVKGTEREVAGITTSGYCIARVKNGRYCDIIASKCSGDSSTWASYYCDGHYYSASTCRVVQRGGTYYHLYCGVVYQNMGNVSSTSYRCSARLAFRGTIAIENDKE